MLGGINPARFVGPISYTPTIFKSGNKYKQSKVCLKLYKNPWKIAVEKQYFSVKIMYTFWTKIPILADGTLNWRAFMWWTNCWHVGDALRLLTPVIFVPLLLGKILKRVAFLHLGSSFIVGPSNEAKAINDYIGARLQIRNRGLRKVDFMILAKTKKEFRKNLKFFRLQNLFHKLPEEQYPFDVQV